MSHNIDFSLDRAITGSQLLAGSGRLGRVEWLTKNLPENDLYFLQDGEFSHLLLTDLLETFVGGQFIATIILGFSFIERTIAGRLDYMGENGPAKEKWRSDKLLKVALCKEWLTVEEHSNLIRLGKLRNPIVHFHDLLAETRPEVKAELSAKTTAQMLESDAKQMLAAAIHVLKKTSL